MTRSILCAGLIGIIVATVAASGADAKIKLGKQCSTLPFNACFSCCSDTLKHCQKRCAKAERKIAKKAEKAKRKARKD